MILSLVFPAQIKKAGLFRPLRPSPVQRPLHPGTADLEYLDGEETAYLLIGSGSGVITPFGVVYDNGMTLEQVYNGRQFPSYPYDSRLMVLEVTPKRGLPEGKNPEYLYLPAAKNQIERTLVRVGVTSPHEAQVRLVFDELPEELAEALDLEQLAGNRLHQLCSQRSLPGEDQHSSPYPLPR